MTGEGSSPCDRFTVLDWRKGAQLSQCVVCDHLEAAHPNPGRRILSGGEIEELRRRLLVERFDMLEAERGRSDGPT